MEYKQNNFYSGITNDIRSSNPSAFWYSENLEINGKALKKVANNQAENAGNYNVNNYITKLIQVGTNIYGLGQDNETNRDTTIWKKTDALYSNWEIVTNGTIENSVYSGGNTLFAYINEVFYLYSGHNYISKYTGTTMTYNWKALQGHSKGGTIWQGRVYFWNGQKVYEIDPVADTLTEKLTITSEQTIVDIVANGNLLYIICTSNSTVSRMYIWDGITTTTFVDIVDIGMGDVAGGAILEGQIIVAIGTPNRRTLKIKGYSNSIFQTLFTYTGRLNRAGTYNFIRPASRLKSFAGYIYFIVTGTQSDGTYAGVYEYNIARFGREEPTSPITFTLYKTLDFSSARGTDGSVTNNDFLIVESIISGATTIDRAVYAMICSAPVQTTFFESSSSTYTAQPGVLETTKFSGSDTHKVKTLLGISAFYSALPNGSQVVCKYKKDEETTWTTIFTDTTDNAVSHEAVNIESSGLALPSFKEIQFRFEITGNVVFTGWKINYNEASNIIK